MPPLRHRSVAMGEVALAAASCSVKFSRLTRPNLKRKRPSRAVAEKGLFQLRISDRLFFGENPERVDDASDTEQEDPENDVNDQIQPSAFFHEYNDGWKEDCQDNF